MQTILSLLLITLLSAFFSGMEIAFVSMDKLRFEMERKPGVTSSIISFFHKHSSDFISTLLVGNNIALVVYGIIMSDLLDRHLFRNWLDNALLVLLLQTLISTMIIIVVGEFLPKTFFKMRPNLMMRIFAVPLFLIYIILYPFSRFSSLLSYMFLALMGQKVSKEAEAKAFGKVDLDYFVSQGIENAEEENLDSEVKIFQNALDFSSVKIRDCMVPRTEIVSVDISTSVEELLTRFIETGISKVIVYDGNIDNVVGYIHTAEMFRNQLGWKSSIKQLPIVPETMGAQRLMQLFMMQKRSIAVVVDEFGGTAGIVTLEDLVEEIFGDIEDEHDSTTYVCKQVSDSEYILSARLEIGKINDVFDLDLPESDDYMTLGGLILDRFQSLPKLHEVIQVESFEFKILKVSATKIELVKLKVTQ